MPQIDTLSSLKDFFQGLRSLSLPGATKGNSDVSLRRFLIELAAYRSKGRLLKFCEEFRPLFESSRTRGDYLNIWKIAGLGHNETATASVLAWLLDENGSHGKRSRILNEWLSRLRPNWANPPPNLSRALHSYRTATEVYPFGSEDSRVDIELDGSQFVLFIEIKVDANEGPDQVARYLAHAKAKAGRRSYAVIFLSRDSNIALSTSSPHVSRTTWNELARTIRGVVGSRSQAHSFVDALVLQFADHVDGL